MTREDFIHMVQVLEAKKHTGIATDILYGNMPPDTAGAISRGEAAMVLYAAVKSRATRANHEKGTH